MLHVRAVQASSHTSYSLLARGQSIPQDKDLLPKLKELFHISMGFLQNSVDSDLLPKLKEAACFACENLKTFMPNGMHAVVLNSSPSHLVSSCIRALVRLR